MIKKIFISITITMTIAITIFNPYQVISSEGPNEDKMVLCQDQADSYGNGKGDDSVSTECLESIKKLVTSSENISLKRESKKLQMTFFGHRNMIIVESKNGPLVVTNIIAGSSTNLNSIQAIALDEKNQEIAVLEDSGKILFFTTTLTGNIAPYRILQHNEILGATELVIDTTKDQVIIYNEKSKSLLFFSRLANINQRKGKQKLNIIKTINTREMSLKNLSIDLNTSKLNGLNTLSNQNITFDLNLK